MTVLSDQALGRGFLGVLVRARLEGSVEYRANQPWTDKMMEQGYLTRKGLECQITDKGEEFFDRLCSSVVDETSEVDKVKGIDLRKQKLSEVGKFVVPDFYRNDLEGILIPNGLIKDRVNKLAQDVAREYFRADMLAICVLDGAQDFYTDLLRAAVPFMQGGIERASVSCKSYEGTESTKKLEFHGLNFSRVTDRHLLVVEDIIDSGKTLTKLNEEIWKHKPKSVEYICLLDKKEKRDPSVTLQPRHIGFTIRDLFVVGYGLDFNETYRDLPHIGVLKEEKYK